MGVGLVHPGVETVSDTVLVYSLTLSGKAQIRTSLVSPSSRSMEVLGVEGVGDVLRSCSVRVCR